jgi:hypothetical protein
MMAPTANVQLARHSKEWFSYPIMPSQAGAYNRLDSHVTITPGQRLGSRHRYSYDSLRPLAQIQFFPDTCSVVTSANPA